MDMVIKKLGEIEENQEEIEENLSENIPRAIGKFRKEINYNRISKLKNPPHSSSSSDDEDKRKKSSRSFSSDDDQNEIRRKYNANEKLTKLREPKIEITATAGKPLLTISTLKQILTDMPNL
jgi:DNA polymerase III delta prime subunit